MSLPTQIELDGQKYNGSYDVNGNTMTVRYLSRSLSQNIGGTPPAIAAKSLMVQLVKIVRDLQTAA